MQTGRNAVSLIHRPATAGAPPPEQVHVQFGADASREIAVSWAAPAAVARPRLRFGRACGRGAAGPADSQVDAQERTYTDALTGETVWTYHARIDGLDADTSYAYQVQHDGAAPVQGTVRTGPQGRSRPFRFTSFGDQSIPGPVGTGLGPSSPNAGYVVDAVEALDPLFHLLNGDLCYANASDQPVATWTSFFANIGRSARHRPWMPAPGNHENEAGNGSQGYLAYQTRFALPANGSPAFGGNWYAFTAGPIRILALNNDDVCLQDGGFSGHRRDNVPGYRHSGFDPYISGYSGGQQRRWLERELAAARQDEDIDWIVVCMHQVAMSSAHFNGADLGVRQQWLPLFDAYGVDLVLAGHEHHFERTFPVRGTLPGSSVLTPAPVQRSRTEMDTTNGTVHITLGGGGHPFTSPSRQLHRPGQGIVIAGVEPGDPQTQRKSVLQTEPAPWSAYRNDRTPYGFAAFDVAPAEPGGTTSITVTYYGAVAGSRAYRPQDRLVLRKPSRLAWQRDGQLAGTGSVR
jgi:Purple acid Phosphatase, N-terminal domain/Calcineurin-like phosphoesterase